MAVTPMRDLLLMFTFRSRLLLVGLWVLGIDGFCTTILEGSGEGSAEVADES